MKKTQLGSLIVLGLVLSLTAVGCKKKPGYLTVLPGSKPGTVGEATPSGAINGGVDPNAHGINSQDFTGVPQGDVRGHVGWHENPEALKAQTVYFAFDSSAVSSGEQAKVAAVADYLKANSQAAVRVEGHCDERGTEGYNLALGERRALAVREELIRLGIEKSRVDTTSYGEDRPAVIGQDDEAYRQNRRGEFIVLTPPQ